MLTRVVAPIETTKRFVARITYFATRSATRVTSDLSFELLVIPSTLSFVQLVPLV